MTEGAGLAPRSPACVPDTSTARAAESNHNWPLFYEPLLQFAFMAYTLKSVRATRPHPVGCAFTQFLAVSRTGLKVACVAQHARATEYASAWRRMDRTSTFIPPSTTVESTLTAWP